MSSGKEKIMLVDDDSSIREVLEYFFTAEGFATEAFESADEAIRALRKDSYGVVVTDLKMAPRDGFDVILAATGLSKPPGIVVVSAFLGTVTLERLRGLGVKYTVSKPVDREELLHKVRRALGSNEEDDEED